MSDERAILEQRTRLLARPRQQALRAHGSLATFVRRGERYAIEARFVYEVARAPRPTALPRSARHWLGVTSLHGELVAVADLPLLLADEAGPAEGDTTGLLLVLGGSTRELALAIDAVLEPVRDDIARQPPPRADAASSLIEGITEDGLRVVRGDLLLCDARLTVSPQGA